MEIRYAGFDRRLFSAILDITILSFILIPFVDTLNYFIYNGRGLDVIISELAASSPDGSVSLSAFQAKLIENGFFYKYLFVQIFSLLLFASYIIFFWVKFGATPGKWILGCQVVNKETKQLLTFSQATKRFLSYIPSTVALCFGFLAIKWDKECRGWHDKMSDTICIRNDSSLNLFRSVFNLLYLSKFLEKNQKLKK